MIEFPDLPTVGRMATRAVLAKTTFMPVVFLMTGIAIFLYILELLREMAMLASDSDMQAHQGKAA